MNQKTVRHILSLAVAAFCSSRSLAVEERASPREIFERRIMPIFQSPNPSSCTQCHLAAVDLKDYILPSHEKTFLSLRDQGLIDLDRPDRSKILTLIQMGERDTPAAALIHAAQRKAEYEAFAEWIRTSAADPNLRAAPRSNPAERAGPDRPPEVIRYTRKDRLLDSFEQNVWSMRFRCMGCHVEGSPENEKHKKEHGERVAWIKSAGAEATMRYLIDKTDLIDTDTPSQSRLLLKPLNEVPHGGGKKFLLGDLGYQAVRTWIEEFAAIVNDQYQTAEQLPKPTSHPKQFGSDIWFKLADTPADWADKLLLVRLYAWDQQEDGWEKEPIAVSDRGVWGKGRLWQHNLVLLAPSGSQRAAAWSRGVPALRPGRYLVKVFVESAPKPANQWNHSLNESDYVGQSAFEARWATGYSQMTVLNAADVRR